MTEVAILVPRRRDGGHRDKLWDYTRTVWAEMFPNWPIVEGHHDDGPFNRSRAVNRAAALAGDWSVALIIDSDVLPDPAGVLAAVEVAGTETRAAAGFNKRRNLNQRGTRLVMDGYKGSWERFIQSEHPLCKSGALAVNRELWNAVGGFDELFIGWGYEDTAFEIACQTASGEEVWQAEADLWHLWHPRSPEHNVRSPLFKANRARLNRYVAARDTMDSLMALLEESAAVAVDGPETRAADAPQGIPRVLHRTVPAETSEEVERFWAEACRLHPGWQHLTHRDPLESGLYPETSDLWKRCKSGAQKAGLIRLEVLWQHGGIYIDSDVELYRPLDSLLQLQGFAAWEDRKVCPDAVMGFKREHPAVAVMLEKARAAVLRGRGAWESGPGVTTSTLPGREDVLLLPPGSFYPYHYKEKELRGEDHAANPWTFGAHHWHHSWDGK